ncbi:MAG: response regulator transcription factor [Eubacterium sp.]|nr:response regulator transcription factor [Eubacterium sp.]
MEQKISTKHRILIIEDDTALAGGLCRALQSETVEAVSCPTLQEAAMLLGVSVTGSYNEAVSPGIIKCNLQGGAEDDLSAQTEEFSLIILDINLPDGSGFDFLGQIQDEYDIPVILLTANDMETDIVAGLNAGADDYITKPFSLAVLRARVETQLRRAAQRRSAGSVVNAGDMAVGGAVMGGTADGRPEPADGGWVIDGAYRFHFVKMLFFHNDEQIELSKGEQKLLRILVENRGITLGREQLIDRIWTEDAAFVYENTLSVTVKRLRDKLGAQEKIKTVYGIGYRWD